MSENKSEQEKFLEDLDVKRDDVFEEPLTLNISEQDKADKEKKEKEEAEFKAKNRRERRLLTENQRLREEAIAASVRAQTLVDAKNVRENSQVEEFEHLVEKIYGNVTPEAKEATEILKQALRGVKESAKAEALKEAVQTLEEERAKESQAVQEEEKNLEDILDSVEETHGIDMSNKAERDGFLNLLEKISPKDKEGNIVEYADPDATAEFYLSRKEKLANRAKELAARSMTHSGASQSSKLEDDATVRYLKENGII